MNLRKTVSLIAILAMLMSLFTVTVSAEGITVYVSEKILQCDPAPFTLNGRTMVPMRKIFEALDSRVDWEDSTETVKASKDGTEIILQINNTTMYNNGEAELLDAAPVISENSTFVPVRAVSQALNASVEWFEYTTTVYINSPITYADDYKACLDNFMQQSIGGAYKLTENIEADASVDDDICVQGLADDILLSENYVYLTVENRYSENEKIAVCLGDSDSTSADKLIEVFKGKNVSVNGKYLGADEALGMGMLSLQYISVFENDRGYSPEELTYPKLSQIDEKVLLYDDLNRPQYVPAARADEFIGAGWTTGARVTMYAPGGKTVTVLEDEVQAYQNVGWYLKPVITMYAPGGKTVTVFEDEVQAYQNVGWYLKPVATLYAPDGRSMTVFEDEVSAYKQAGWYGTYAEAQASVKPSSTVSISNEPAKPNRPNSGGSEVYRTPSGQRYHFDPDCGGKNSYRITMEQALNGGLTPCKKCAQ